MSRTVHAGLWRAFACAGRGLTLAAQGRNFRLQTVMALLVLSAGLYFRFSPLEWGLVVLAIGLVLALEAMNSAVEVLADRVCPEPDPLIGQCKDLAAAAVLLAAFAAAALGLALFLPRLLAVVGV